MSRLGHQLTLILVLHLADLANATTTQREALAQLALKLNQYLASGQPLKPGEKVEELIPVDMGEFGFSNVAEVMNLCSAVSL